MRWIFLTLTLAAAPALAQDAQDPLADLFKELQKLGENSQSLMENFADQMAPLMEDMLDQLGDLNAYEAPEILPNGDIIIRRKSPPEKPKTDQIDL